MIVDNYSYYIAQKLIKQIDFEFAYDYGSGLVGLVNLIKTSPVKNIIFVMDDNLLSIRGNNWIGGKIISSDIADIEIDKVIKNSDKNIIIFSSVENLKRELDFDNVYIIPIGGCITKQSDVYPTVNPVIEKNLNSDKSFISLNHSARPHRIINVNYLYGLDLDEVGYISHIEDKFYQNYLDIVSWKFNETHYTDQDILNYGNKKLLDMNKIPDDLYDPGNKNDLIDNAGNFEKLRSRYENSFVEIINETNGPEPAFLATEKYLHSIYACNFPIINGSSGTVKFLREFGFDVFDDIIDHSYDTIEHPIDRIFATIKLNLELLKDVEKTKKLWVANQQRFLKNVEFVREEMYLRYEQRAEKIFEKVMQELQDKI